MAGTVRWGVLGAAGIALNKVIPGMLKGTRGTVEAIASRDPAKASAAAARLGLPRSHGSYEALLADPEIDAIYVPLPNHLHVSWSIKALQAGKHVLCEKPIALTAEDAQALVEAREASGRQVLEAFMVRQHPQWLRARDIAGSGRLGEVRLVQTTMGFYNVDPDNVRNRADIGGGALYDIGCYAVLLARFMFGAEPRRVVALIDRDPDLRIDRLTSALVDFGAGRQLVFSCSTQLARFQTVEIFGTGARLAVPVSLNAPQGGTTEILLDETGAPDGSGVVTEELPACDQYTLQSDEAARIFLGETRPAFPIEDAVANMRVIDAIYRSGASGHWEEI